jgi:hypothetical protein
MPSDRRVAVSLDPLPSSCDVAIVGAGAAGLMTAIQALRHWGQPIRARVVVLDGAAKPGAKILISGGSRCNVTNAVVSERDFWGGRQAVVRRILRAFPVAETVAFFEDQGVGLKEEEGGKLFPASNQSRDVLVALLRSAVAAGAAVHTGARVTAVERKSKEFALTTPRGAVTASAVVLATGGLSLPKTGSDGGGLAIARTFGHTIVTTTPALAPLTLDEHSPFAINDRLTGISHDVELAVWIDGSISIRLTGALLWTHFGVSGPVALNASRHWAKARAEGRSVRLTSSFYPTRSFEEVDALWIARSRSRPTQSVRSALAADLPGAAADAVLDALAIARDLVLADLSRDLRRRLVHGLTEWPLPVRDTRGYNYAEATAGGVALTEIDPGTMESRQCSGLYLVGEMLDVDGRLGGFNFQWAWATGTVAGLALARAAV